MRRHGLIVRLMIPLGIMVALVLAVLVFGHRASSAIRAADASVAGAQARALALTDLRSTSRSLQRDALNLVTERDRDELAAIRQKFDKRAGEFGRGLTRLAHDPATESAGEFAEYMRTQRRVLVELNAVRGLAARDRAGALALFGTGVRPQERHASKIADRLIERLNARHTRLSRAAEEIAARQEQRLDILVATASIVALALGVLAIIWTVILPLRAIQRAMEALAGGDATVVIPGIDRPDAIGAMARAIAIFRDATRERDGLRAARDAERVAAERSARAAEDARHREAQRDALEAQRKELLANLADAVEASLSAVNGKLRSSAARLTQSAAEVARHAAAAGDEAERTGASAHGVARDLAASTAATTQIAEGVARLNAEAGEATDAVRLAVARSRTAAARVSGLADYADRVGEMNDLIKTVSRRSQLLALNATIEAARVGEAGRGFGVVATEMKRLSAQAAAAATHIEGELSAIRAAAGEGTTAIEEIGEAVGQIEDNAERLARAMGEQGAANEEIARNVHTALASVDAVGSRMADLGHSARGTRDLAGTLQTDAEALSADASRVDSALRELVARLKAA